MRNLAYFLSIFFTLFLVVFFCGDVITRANSLDFQSVSSGSSLSSSSSFKLQSSVGQLGSGLASSGSYKLNSGYEQEYGIGTYISIAVTYSSGEAIDMNSISGFMSGQSGTGSAEIKVTTDYAGYALNVKATTSPALKCDSESGCNVSDDFDDYTPVGGIGVPDYDWEIDSADAAFGFTSKGSDILAKYKYDTEESTCGSGSGDLIGDYCWDGFSTTNASIASSQISNHPDGATTVLKLKSQIGTSKSLSAGTYEAGIVVTAITNL